MLVPGQTISAGVCLQSFVVATTDEAFVPQFLDRFLDNTGQDGQHAKVRFIYCGEGRVGTRVAWLRCRLSDLINQFMTLRAC